MNVTLSNSAFETLKELAERKHSNMASVLRDAISLEKWIQDAKDDGYRILFKKKGRYKELLIR